jgi:transposase
MNSSKMRGKKGAWHGDPHDPPRRRANKRRGRGTFDNDRPPVCGVLGRHSKQVRLRVVNNTQTKTLCPFVERFTLPEATLYTDEYDSYNALQRLRLTVCHGQKEWARDANGDGIREVHINSQEGCWTGLRAFLRPFRGVHKRYLSGYVAVYELAVNHKTVSPSVVSPIVRPSHLF